MRKNDIEAVVIWTQVGVIEESIQPVAEVPVERVVRSPAQATPQMAVLDSLTSTSTQVETMITASTTATVATAAMQAPVTPSVIPVEPMPTPVPGVPSPYHAADFCVPVGPDFSLVTGGLVVTTLSHNRVSGRVHLFRVAGDVPLLCVYTLL